MGSHNKPRAIVFSLKEVITRNIAIVFADKASSIGMKI